MQGEILETQERAGESYGREDRRPQVTAVVDDLVRDVPVQNFALVAADHGSDVRLDGGREHVDVRNIFDLRTGVSYDRR